MTYDKAKHHRRSIRWPGHDYAQPAAYFVTLCTHDHQPLFGHVIANEVQLNAAGRIAETCWRRIPTHFPDVELDQFIIMPNHIHGILIIVRANNHSPLPPDASALPVRANDHSPRRPRGTSKTLGSVIRGFKIGVTKWMRQNTDIHHVWQRNYYERVIRDDQSLHDIRRYIADNPAAWMHDKQNPHARSHG